MERAAQRHTPAQNDRVNNGDRNREKIGNPSTALNVLHREVSSSQMALQGVTVRTDRGCVFPWHSQLSAKSPSDGHETKLIGVGTQRENRKVEDIGLKGNVTQIDSARCDLSSSVLTS